MSYDLPDFARFHKQWQKLQENSGARADLRKVSAPEELFDIPAFYRLMDQFGWKSLSPWQQANWQRLVFLAPHLRAEGRHSLGKALATSKAVSEKRMFQVLRSDSPQDVVQLRRLLKHADPAVDWTAAAKQLWCWQQREKRSLLEDFVLNQNHA